MFHSNKLNIYKAFILILMALWASISLATVIRNTDSKLGANDLYTYWYSGHFIRQGTDPYKAFLEYKIPNLPIQYLDGYATQEADILLPELIPAPGYTYPFLLFFTPFAFFTWNTAKWAWLILNICLAILLPVITFQFLDISLRPPGWLIATTCFLVLGLTSTRYALSSGQVTMLVLLLMLLSLILSKNHPWIAGMLLGFALSKYSLSAGLLIYFLFIHRNLRLVASAVLVQITGYVMMILTFHSTIQQALQGYTMMFTHHAPMDGIHLASISATDSPVVDISAAVVITLVAVLPFYINKPKIIQKQQHLVAFCGLLSWSLLVAYHRLYDTAGLISFYCIVISIFSNPKAWGVDPKPTKFLLFFLFGSLALLLLPAGSQVRALLPTHIGSAWIMLVGRFTTFITLVVLGISIWLWQCLKKPDTVLLPPIGGNNVKPGS